MFHARAVCKAARKIATALVVIGAVLLAASCGKEGSIYGSIQWDYSIYAGTVGGFPSYIAWNVYYKVNPGSYEVDYILFDGTYYYPGGTSSPMGYWYGYYTVTADKGSFLSDGKDSYFQLYLGYDGLYKAGDVASLVAPGGPAKTAPRLGTQSWTQDGLLITVTNRIVKLTPEQLAKIQKSQFEKNAK